MSADVGASGFPLPFLVALRVRGALRLLGLRRGEPLLPRLIFLGVDPGEAVEALRSIRSPSRWTEIWERLARSHQEAGRRFAAAGDGITAAESLLRSAACFRAAEFLETAPEGRRRLWEMLVAVTTEGGQLLDPPLERILVKRGGVAVPVLFRGPATADPPPCVVTLGGVDGVKEEFNRITQAYVDRGWASVALDLPGQGELRRLRGVPWRADPEDVVSAVLDELVGGGRIDGHRVVVVGGSAGGYFALRVAASDRRVIGCAVLSGPLDLLDVYRTAPPPIPKTMEYNLGVESSAEAVRLLARFSIGDRLAAITCPVLQVHGGADGTVPIVHAERLRSALPGQVTSLIFEDGDHLCFNHLPEWEASLRNWLTDLLGTPVRRLRVG
jgi:2,6-dihydroxypseudooxynicotine hydrolase